MALRYWVLGTGTWDLTTTTNWSTSSGGAGGASAPTVADSVIFDVNSNVGTTAFTVSIPVAGAKCLDFTVSGLDATMSFSGTGALEIRGSLSWPATGISRTYSGAINFSATTSVTIGLNGFNLNGSAVTFSGSGTYTLTSAFSSASVTHSSGTFDTGGFSLTSSNAISLGASATKFYARTSTITTGLALSLSIPPANFDCGTSTFVISVANPTFGASGYTFYNFSFSATPTLTPSITGSNTYLNNFTVVARVADGVSIVTFTAGTTQTINGQFVSSNTASQRRTLIQTNVIGSTATINTAGVSLADTDFRDINITGVTASGTRLGDAGGNSGITFPAAKTVYFSNTAGASGNYSAVVWALTAGGTADAANFPLAQDTILFDNAGLNTSGVITVNYAYYLPSVRAGSRTNAMTWAVGAFNVYYHGSIRWTSAITVTGGVQWFLSVRSATTVNITNALPGSWGMDSPGATVTLLSNITIQGVNSAFTHTKGTLLLNGFDLYAGRLFTNSTYTREISYASGGRILNANTTTAVSFLTAASVGLTVTPNSSGKKPWIFSGALASGSSVTIDCPTLTEAQSFDVSLTSGAAGSTITFTGNFHDLDFTGCSSTIPNSALSVYGSVNLGSTASFSAGTNAWTLGTTSSTTFTSNGKTVAWPITQNGVGGTVTQGDAFTLGATRTFTLTSGTWNDGGFNSSLPTVSITGALARSLVTAGTLTNAVSWTASGSNATFSGTGVVSMTNASSKTFAGGGFSYSFTLNQGGAGALTITGANTFGNITNSVVPCTISLPAGITTTVSNLGISGSALGQVTFNSSTPGTQATISDASGLVDVSYCTIKDSNATGGATFRSVLGNGNIDNGNNLGWLFISLYTASVVEDVSASDTLDIAFLPLATVVETGAVTDVVYTDQAHSTLFADSLTATDDTIPALLILASTIDTTTVGDVCQSYAIYPTTVVETSGITDTVTAQSLFFPIVSDSISITDTNTSESVCFVSIIEVNTLTDALNAQQNFLASISEALNALDASSGFNTIASGFSDSVNVSDAISGVTALYVLASDAVAAADTLETLSQIQASIAENTSATDNVSRSLMFFAVVNENTNALDAVVVAPLTFDVSIAETLSAVDSENVTRTLQAVFGDSVVVLDSIAARNLWEQIATNVDGQWNAVSTNANGSWQSINTSVEGGWTKIPTVN